MVKNCKSVFLREFLWPMFFQWVIDFVVSDEWILRSSKPSMARVPLLSLQCIFQSSTGNGRSKDEDGV
jgi:hypothetical protein